MRLVCLKPVPGWFPTRWDCLSVFPIVLGFENPAYHLAFVPRCHMEQQVETVFVWGSHMYVTCGEPLSSSCCPGCHIKLSQGVDYLFVRKTPSLSVYFCDCYCCFCCAFLIPLLFAFNKLWSQPKVCFCSSLARRGIGKGLAYLELNFWMVFKPLHG